MIEKKNISIFKRKTLVFLYAFFSAGLFTLFWILAGEKWKVFGDAVQYLAVYHNDPATAPFGYRILVPYLARLFPFGATVNFAIVTIAFLILTNLVIVKYSQLKNHSPVHCLVFSLFWLCSFAFVYYVTTWIRADAPMLFLLALIILLSQYRISVFALFFILALGLLSHETMLIGLFMLWIDNIFHGSFTGGNRYKYYELIFITLLLILFWVLTRYWISVKVSSDLNYTNSFFALFTYVLEYSGGLFKHGMRIYAAYGPVLIYSFLFITRHQKNNKISFFSFLFAALVATFFATDTLRVMAIIYFPVLYYAANYIELLWKNKQQIKAISLVLLQMSYSYIVYGHLRTFEQSLLLTVIAALLSAAALLITLFHNKSISGPPARTVS
ncbi:MAG: EpsG family protein [candidate division KSB1 bacterium]|nr:EpsG family protein [candidate division KSB1 bacterium]